MDRDITTAARALAAGDPVAALNRVALRNDAPALALRGIAMAQLGDLEKARALMRRAASAFGPRAAVARARCVVSEAEIALASRDLAWPMKRLDAARVVLETQGDRANAGHARTIEIRRLLLIGRLDEAELKLIELDPDGLPLASRAACELAAAGIAMRRLQTQTARAALERAGHAARQTGIGALNAEIESAWQMLRTPAARLMARGEERLLRLEEVQALLGGAALVVDACRYGVSRAGIQISLARRPVLFALARELAQAWPGDASRELLMTRAFGLKLTDDSHRARLRVEMGRLRKALRPLADVVATRRGFIMTPRDADEIQVLAHVVEQPYGAVLALLADGEAWSSSALALALDTSQRSVQRALETLAASGKAQSFGRARARRWTAPPMPGFATVLLLTALPLDG
ncbi:helix-turn-helix domain-containing protein [Pseudomonas brassicacearum]|uniref:Helix-turn-helix domain-containing protein n=1 Tax=Pseudomonas brassicacearum subsp. neoaurantiaca TaxID=494916 RepID=A0A7V8UCG5_9PSED|nr:helix-turn-helix domain-containing protein [Pseudomonas brassicacearum]MBA1378009.1 helix-turn-helix domain-containing protein [Pseudomonas brassicacearum subsp. neoaurantiaca]